MSADINARVSSVMEQAQVFASTWSLVGGQFDNGDMLADAQDAKRDLEAAVRETLASGAVILIANFLRQISGTDWSKQELVQLADNVEAGRRKVRFDQDHQ